MKTKRVFRDIERYIFREDQDDEVTSWVREVSMGVAGSIDHVLVKRKSYGKLAGGVKDFACVEFQAAGTTGSPYPAIEDYVKTGEFQERGYDYGINWANEFVKTMMQQVYKKGRKIEEWNKKMIWVIQDIALEYLESEYDTSGLRDAAESDPIHFFTLKVAWENGKNKWILKSDKKKSTDISGIRKILLGPPPEKYPSLDEFKSEIEKKLRINKN